jgi:hypothetical protein
MAEIHAAGGNFMEQWLPQMSPRFVDQNNIGLAATTERVAEPGRKLKTSSTAANDDDAVPAARTEI